MTSWAQLWAELPSELQACCADKLLTPSAGRFSLASKACKDLVGEKLAEAKAAHEAALVEAAAARAAAQPRRRTKISAAGGDFIDTYVDEYKISSSTAREALVDHILAVAAGDERLGSANWQAATIYSRLSNVMKARNRANRAA